MGPKIFPAPRESLLPFLEDQHLSYLAPHVLYWILSLGFEWIEERGLLKHYKLHTTAESMKKNSASKASVFKLVLFSQATQIALGYYTARSETFYLHSYHVQNLFEKIHNVSIFFTSGPCNSVMGPSTNISASCSNTQPSNTGGTRLDSVEAHQVIQSALETASQWQWLAALLLYWVFIPIWQFVLALLLQDAFQYFMHRLNHTKWLYKNVHYLHHSVYVPYAWGASYAHPLESLPIDTFGYPFGLWLAGMSNRQETLFSLLWTVKMVFDHCGYEFPWNPCNLICPNATTFHDLHHQPWGLKYNYSVYLDIWDRWLGTRWDGRDQRATAMYKRATERLGGQNASKEGNEGMSSAIVNGASGDARSRH